MGHSSMGGYNKGYDVMGEPVTIMPPNRPPARISDGAVMARIEKEIYDVVEQECACDLDELPPGYRSEEQTDDPA